MTPAATPKEIMATVIANDLQDGEWVEVGANLPVPREPTRREQGYGPNPNYSGPHAGSGYGPTSGPGYGSGTYGPPQQDWYWRPSLATVA